MTPLVLLPGMMCDARLFTPQIEAISSDRAVMTAPIHGHDRIEALAADVLEWAPPRFALAGLSMGGIVAMEVLRQAPDRIDRIALLDTNPRAEDQSVQASRKPQIEKVLAGGLWDVMRNELKPNYLTDGLNRGAILDLCMHMADALGPQAFVRQSLALMHRPDQTKTLAVAKLPALVLCGRDDALCPVHRHETMHELLAGSSLTILDGAGHLPTLEQPEATTCALRGWLAQ